MVRRTKLHGNKRIFSAMVPKRTYYTCSGEATYSHVNKTQKKRDQIFESHQYQMGKY